MAEKPEKESLAYYCEIYSQHVVHCCDAMHTRLVYSVYHRRTVHRGLGGPGPLSFLKICRRAPQFLNKFIFTVRSWVYCTVQSICMRVEELSKWLPKVLPISEKPKLTLLEFRYFGIILKWLGLNFGISVFKTSLKTISVYRYSNIDIPNPAI